MSLMLEEEKAVAVEKKAEPFSEAEKAAMHAEDVHTATAIAGIMVAIFVIAVVLYTVIALIAAAG